MTRAVSPRTRPSAGGAITTRNESARTEPDSSARFTGSTTEVMIPRTPPGGPGGRATRIGIVVGIFGLVALAAIAGCRPRNPGTATDPAPPFAATSPWNTPIAGGTRWFDTPALHRLATPLPNGDSTRHWWVNAESVGLWWAAPTDPVWTFRMPDYLAPAWNRNRPASTFTMRAPVDLVAGTDVDHILVVIDRATGEYTEVWEAQVDPATHTVTNRAGMPGWARGNLYTGPGAGDLANNNGVRAANFSWAAGLITGTDLHAQKIDHAVVVSLPAELLKGGGMSGSNAWRSPATAWDAGGWGGRVQMGSRIGIPAGTPMPAGLSPIGRMIFDTLTRYGAFVGDYGGGPWPMFYVDNRSVDRNGVDRAAIDPLISFWDHNGSADMEKLGPLLRVADYQP